MRITMLGTGYVGLVSGACFAEFGSHVTCVDQDIEKIQNLKQGKIPIYEPGLETLVTKHVSQKRLDFTTNAHEATRTSDIVFLAVGTPTDPSTGKADLSYIFQAAEEIANFLNGYTVIATKSTVPVGTGKRLKQIIQDKNPHADFDVVSNPEFLREGSAIEDFLRPDRVVIGADSQRAETLMRRLYQPLYLIETPIVFTKVQTAELIKYATNAFLATKITFINEIADFCEKVDADVQQVAKCLGLDGRISPKFLHAGPGYGGSCFPKDTLALVKSAKEQGVDISVVDAVVKSNTNRKKRMADKIIQACGGDVQGKTIGILGLTFKPNTDDMRESPSLEILPILKAKGAHIQAFDPEGMEEAKSRLPEITYCQDIAAAAQGADALVLLTEWNVFRALDFQEIKKKMHVPLIIDLRNMYRLDTIQEQEIDYVSIGRGSVFAKKSKECVDNER